MHAAFPAVFATYPDRKVAGVDGYFAPVLCSDLGKDYTLLVGGRLFTVRAADCAAWTVGEWPQKRGERWLGDLDESLFVAAGLSAAPQRAVLCELSPARAMRGGPPAFPQRELPSFKWERQ